MGNPRAERARARAGWSLTRIRLGDEPGDVLEGVAPAECVAMVWQLTLDAWASSGRRIPDYERTESPGRIVRLRPP